MITLAHGDVPGIPFPDNVADLVVMFDGAELVPGVGGADHSEGLALLHLHHPRLHLGHSEGGDGGQQGQAGEENSHLSLSLTELEHQSDGLD